jgi:hypothetical protein
MKFRVLRENRNLWLLTCFTIYAIFFFVFAGIYYVIFKADPNNFLFNFDIIKSRTSRLTAPIEKEISDAQLKIDIYREFLNQPFTIRKLKKNNGQEIRIVTTHYVFKYWFKSTGRGNSFSLHSGYEYFPLSKGAAELDSQEATELTQHFLLECMGSDDKLESTDEGEFAVKSIDESFQNVRNCFSFCVAELEDSLIDHRNSLVKLQRPTPQIWSYWDFLYFSVITQTTVGYGDILPNSTLIRMVVSAQLIISLMILTILISLTFKRRKLETPDPPSTSISPESPQDEIK